MTRITTKRSSKNLGCGIAFCLVSLFSSAAYPQQYAPAPGAGTATGEQAPSATAPTGAPGGAGVRLDPFVIYPSVSLAEGYNDNVGLSQNNKIGSAVTVLSPAILAELKGARSTFHIGYTGTYGVYANSSADNYDYHAFRGDADFDFSTRSNLKLTADYLIQSDPRGFTLASTAVSTPNKYDQGDIGGIFSYGAAGAQGRVELQTLLTDKRYTNNRAVTSSLDYDSQLYRGAFYWRVAPKTEWLIEGRDIQTNYSLATTLQDNAENDLLTGLKWEATALTTGTAKIGYSEKKYTDTGAAQSKARGGIWEIAVRWSPLTYSVVDLATGKRFTDSQAGPGSTFATTEYVTLAWNHGWSERVRSTLGGAYETDSYAGIGREDKVGFVSAKLAYDMRRWLTLGAEYKLSDRDSNVSGADYRQNLFMLSVRATM